MATLAQVATPQFAARSHHRFGRYAWCVLGWNVIVVLWGAYVRASGSGAGCGSHWPLCNGAVIPPAPRAATIIEFSHRLTSGVALLAVAALCFWAFRTFPQKHPARRMAALSVIFLLLEALLGAGLVLFSYVDKNASTGRAIYLSAHLVNTQLLLGVLTLTAWFAGRGASGRRLTGWTAATLPVALLVSVTGAIAALGDTLFPATSFAAGFTQDFSSTAHFLLRLRIIHPAMAVCAGVFFAVVAVAVLRKDVTVARKRAAWAVALLVMLQLYAGAMNVLLLAPVWLQLVHLLLADSLWIALVILSYSDRSERIAEGSGWSRGGMA